MLIHVVYNDNRFDYVKESMLDELIHREQVIMFKRCTGWVTIGIDPIRGRMPMGSYFGAERRGGSPAPLYASHRRLDS